MKEFWAKKQEEAHCALDKLALISVPRLPQEKVQCPQILVTSHIHKSMKMINLRYLISVFHRNHLPAFMLDFMYFLGKNHIVFTATSSEQWSQS